MQLNKIQKQVLKKSVKYVTGAFGLVAAFAWKDAIQALIQFLFPLEKNSLIAKFIYAGIMTIVLVIITIYLTKWLGKKE